MAKLTQAEWTQQNKHDLRELYADFLEDQAVSSNEVSYVEFQDFMYSQTKHGAK